MAAQDLRDILSYARLGQLPRYARRALGLPTARADDFLVQLEASEGERLGAIAASVRGPNPPPAIFVHGVLPRSGTNFLSDALALHPNIAAHPGRLWEFPLLYVAPGAAALQQEFLFMYKCNREVLGRYDLLAYLAAGWLASLQREAGDRHILLKSPHVQNITLFRHVFPNDVLLLCLRDGRDVIESSMNTFRRGRLLSKSFAELAREWHHGAEAILTFGPGGDNAYPNAKVVRYEQLVQDPESTIREVLALAGLASDTYDFQALRALPVRGSSSLKADADRRWMPQEKPRDFQPIGRWHAAWSSRQKNRFKAIAGATLVRAGYAADGHW